MHLKGRWIINLVLVVILLLDGEKFLVHEEDVFVPILSMSLRRHSALVLQISFKAGVGRCPFEQSCAVVCRSSLRLNFIGSICSALRT